ncbi:TPA: hypothetical protein NV432_002829 [Citrobacter freundii]|nr:hypothetical protein [Citrobacter freundii]
MKKMSNGSPYVKIIPATGKWYLLVEGDKNVEVADGIYPIAAWAELSDGKIVGLSNVGKYQPAELFTPPPGFKCRYLREEELSSQQLAMIGTK